MTINTPQGISLHIGVNIVDPEHYKGWSGPLSSCENDADAMCDIARSQGFETYQLKTTEATREAVTGAIKEAAGKLTAGDFFLLSYSGHGGQVRDFDGDEEDGKDDTWCLYDGQLLDDEFYVLFAEFSAGVRVLMLSDSCHSGTMLKGVTTDKPGREVIEDDFTVSRAMPRRVAMDTMRKNRSQYIEIQRALPDPLPEVMASVRLLSGCQEEELSYGNKVTGRFTEAVRKVFSNGEFEGNYKQFHAELIRAVSKAMNPQTPGHMFIGAANADFDSQSPFRIK